MKTNVFKIDTDVTQSGAHVLEAGQQAKFSFGPEDISGVAMQPDGALVISFVEGGELTIKNFESLANSGATLTLADGTVVDQTLATSAPKLSPVQAENDNHMMLDIPSEGIIREITLEPGQQYIFNFAIDDVVEAKANIDGSYILSFGNGAKIVLSNYDEAMDWDNHPIISADPFITTANNDSLLTNIERLVLAKAEEEVEDGKPQSKIAKADVDADAQAVAAVEPAAGEEALPVEGVEGEALDDLAALADALAEVEPAAGETAAPSSNSGYGYNSTAATVPLGSIDAVGPLGRTVLKYNVNYINEKTPIIAPLMIDDKPIFDPIETLKLDESTLPGGPMVAQGQVTVNFGIDGPGIIVPNGIFYSNGSIAPGGLKSDGVPVVLFITADGYEAKAGTDIVFTFVIDRLTGEYTFTQYLPLDHADGNNPDDEIKLEFGIVARDNDGDPTQTFVKIIIADDAPIAHMSTAELDEAGISPAIVTGSLVYNYGADADGTLTPSGSFTANGSLVGGLTSGGVPVTVTQTPTGYVGMAGTVPVFTLHINLDTGEYTYTQLAVLDHADGNDSSDVITLNFGVEVTDGDGDSVTTDIRIDVIDDAPVAVDENGVAIEDQTITGNLLTNDTLSVDGNTVTQVSFNGAFFNVPANGSINVIGNYGILTIHSNGDYSYTANHNNPDGTDSFTYTLTDGDGDSSTANLSIAVSPIDDIPVIIAPDVKTVDETFLGIVQESGLVQADFGTDGPGTYQANGTFLSGGSLLGGTLTHNGLPVVVDLVGRTYIGTANGETIFTMQFNDIGEYTFTLFQPLDHADATNPDDSIQLQFGFTAFDGDDDTADGLVTVNVLDDGPIAENDDTFLDIDTFTATGNLLSNDDVGADGGRLTSISFDNVDYPVPASGNITITTPYGTLVVNASGQYTYTITDMNAPAAFEVFTYRLTDNDGDTATATATFEIESRDNIPVLVKPDIKTVDEDNLTPTVVVNGQVTGEFYDDGNAGFTGTGTFNADGSMLGGALTHQGVPVTVAFNPATGTYTGTAGSVTVFTLTIAADGNYTFTLLDTLDHGDPNDPNDIITLEFGVQGTDLDGDSDDTVITINVKDSVPSIGGGHGDVDESNLNLGPVTYTDTIDANLVGSGAVVAPGGGTFSSEYGVVLTAPPGTGGPMNPPDMLSGGSPVVVTATANGYIGVSSDNSGRTIFTLEINPTTGQYTFTLLEPLTHLDSSDHNDIITLNFPITVTTLEGEVINTNITIDVADDGVDARNDVNGAEEDQFITGNVLSNDFVGVDASPSVYSVTFNGMVTSVPAGGSVTINGTYGTLVMNSDGTYSYQATAEDPNGQEVFTYTLSDGDGDRDTATLTITVTPDGTPVAVSQFFDVDETNILNGQTTYNGTLNIDAGKDGLASVTANNSFTASGSMGAQLTSGGLPITVALVGGQYVGTAGGQTIFTLSLANDGSYTFTLLDTLDHADSTDPNDVIKLEFGVTVADRDGDTVDGLVTIHVHDSNPTARADINGAEEDQLITGNVLGNDFLGEDAPNEVTSIMFNGLVTSIPAGESITINGTYGTLLIKSNGSYTYQATAEDPNGQEVFTYTLRDGDGDTDKATLTITVTPDGAPVAVSGRFDVDETNMLNGETTYTGALHVDAGLDGLGSVTANNSFTASGSMGAQLTSGGLPVTVALVGGQYVGTAGGNTIFTLSVSTNGTYTFTLLDTLDHADSTDPNDVIKLEFGITLTDTDGDSVNGQVTVHVHDSNPTARADINGAEEDQLITGNVLANDFLGEDTPSEVTNVLFGGQNYAVPAGGSVTINGTYGTLVMNSNGTYTYQATAEDPNGVENFVYTLRDGDGDTNVATLDITVTPDGEPVAVTATFDVDETNMAGGQLVFTGALNVNFGVDGAGSIMGNGQFISSGSQAGGQLTSNGQPITVTQMGGVYIGTAGGQTIFTLTLNNNATYEFKLFDTLDHANGSDPNDVIRLQFGVTASDSDGDSVNGMVSIHVHDDAPVAIDDVFTAHSPTPPPPPPPPPPPSNDVPVAENDAYTFLETDMLTSMTGPGGGFTTGRLGSDATTGNGVTLNVMSNDKLSADGGNQIISAIFVDMHGNPIETGDQILIGNAIYKVKIAEDGLSLNLSANGPDWNGHNQMMYIKYTIQDANGDVSSAIATVTQQDNTSPLVIDLDGDGIELIDSTDGVMFDMGSDGTLDKTGWAAADDGLLVIDKNNDGIINNQSELFGTSETDGFTVLSQYDSNGDGKITNADALWNKLMVWQDANSDGISQASELKTLSQIGIDSINLAAAETGRWIGDSFISHESTFTWSNGTTGAIADAWFATHGTDNSVTVEGVRYDLPDNAPEGAVVGNVLANDTASQDVSTTVISITIGGQTFAVAPTGQTVIQGQHGKLTISANGGFFYEPAGGNATQVIETFRYTVRDGDGDTNQANLRINIEPQAIPDDTPEITNATATVDESNLVSVTTSNQGGIFNTTTTNTINNHTITQTGSISVDYGNDGPGTVSGSGTFNATGSLTANALSHNGTAVTVSYNAATGIYTGLAGTKTVFTMKINANGTYEFKQFENLDHADGTNANDVINLNFGVRATDADGDIGTGTVTINVRDSAPDAINDTATAEAGGTATGNLRTNDFLGSDDGAGARVTSFTYNSQTYAVAESGWTTVNIVTQIGNSSFQTGTIRVRANGDYQVNNSIEGNVTLTYTLRDHDGDTDTATLITTFTAPPPPPVWGDGGDGGGGDGGGSPLVLDLNGDGVSLTKTQDGVLFDLGNDGIMDLVSWVQSDDALLGIDLDGDGVISGHHELFGSLDEDGFNVLARYNSNGDGVIDANDVVWSALLAWRDMNQDGKSTADELFSMEDLGIASISLNVQTTDFYVNGSWIPFTSTFTMTDGTTHGVYDSWFKYISVDNWMQVVNTLGYEAAVAWIDATYATALTGDNGLPTSFDPDAPIIMGPVEKVFENSLTHGEAGASDKLQIFYGDDQPGEMSGNGKFHASGSLNGGLLMHDGIAIEVTFDAATGLYKGMAGEEVIFTMQIGDDGTYDFKLFQTLDHADNSTNLDNFIVLQFGITVTDDEGDISESAIRLQVINEGSDLAGIDDLYGTEGADTFLFQTIKESATTLHDFNKAEGDKLDLTVLLDGIDGVTEAIGEFVHSRTENGSTVISVDLDGAGAGAAVDIVKVDGVPGLDIQEMLNDGNLII